MSMTKQTVDTIRFALAFLRDVNYSVAFNSSNSSRFERAKSDIQKDSDAIVEFETLINAGVIDVID